MLALGREVPPLAADHVVEAPEVANELVAENALIEHQCVLQPPHESVGPVAGGLHVEEAGREAQLLEAAVWEVAGEREREGDALGAPAGGHWPGEAVAGAAGRAGAEATRGRASGESGGENEEDGEAAGGADG